MEPQTLKGFRDFLPEQMRTRTYVINVIKKHFELFGYQPLETPTLEYDEILTGKYGEDEKLMYRFVDHGGRRVAMKYDLTVPASRVIAQYHQLIPMPFKRYQMQPVWRADNTQRGRYRELWQCDADIFGTSSLIPEAEWLVMGQNILSELGFTEFYSAISNRKFLNGIVRAIGADDNEFKNIAISIDKLDKIGWDGVAAEMAKRGLTTPIIQKLREALSIQGSNKEKITHFSSLVADDQEGKTGLAELQSVIETAISFGAQEQHIDFNPTIVRGLSYYTGTVWEWQIPEGNIGSVGGGGRYDHLIASLIGREIPAAGGSFGLERLIDIISQRQTNNYLTDKRILIANFGEDMLPDIGKIAILIRQNGCSVEYYPEKVKLEKQFKYAQQKKIKYVLLYGLEEHQQNIVQVKDIENYNTEQIPVDRLTTWLSNRIN